MNVTSRLATGSDAANLSGEFSWNANTYFKANIAFKWSLKTLTASNWSVQPHSFSSVNIGEF